MEARSRAPVAVAVAVLILLAAALVAVRPLERELRVRVSDAATRILGSFESELGLKLSFEALSPSVLRALSLGGVTIANAEGRTLFRARRADVFYDITALLFRREQRFPFRIDLEQVEARLSPPDLELLAAIAAKYRKGAAPELPRMSVTARGVSLVLEGFLPGPADIELKRLSLDAGLAEPALAAEGRATLSGLTVGPTRLDFDLRGSLSRAFDQAMLRIGLAASSRDFSFRTQQFDLEYAQGKAELRKVRDAAALDLLARYDGAAKTLSLSLLLDDYAPASSFRVSGRLAFLAPWLEVAYRGSLRASLPLAATQELRYECSLAGAVPETVLAGGYQAELKAQGSLATLDMETARIFGPLGSLSYRGSLRFNDLAPAGILSVDARLLSGQLPLRAEVHLYGEAGRYAALTQAAMIGGVEFPSLALESQFSGREAIFSLSALLPEEEDRSREELPYEGEAAPVPGAPRLKIDGSLGLDPAPSIELAVGFESAHLASLAPLLGYLLSGSGLQSLTSLSVDGEVFVRSDFQRLSYSTTNLAIVSTALPGAYALLSGSGNERELRLRNARLSYGNYGAELSGVVGFPRSGGLAFTTQLLFDEVPYAVEGSLLSGTLNLQGDYGFVLSLSGIGSGAGLALSLKSESFPIPLPKDLPQPLGGRMLITTIDADARFNSPEDWSLAVANFALNPAPGAEEAFPLRSLAFSGVFGPESGKLATLSLRDAASSIEGGGVLSYHFGGTPALEAELAFSSASGESYQLQGKLSAEVLEATVDLARSPIGRFWKGPVQGALGGRLLLSGTPDAPRAAFELHLEDASFQGSALQASAEGQWAENTVAVAKGTVRWAGLELSDLGASFSPATGEARAQGRFRASDGISPIRFDFDAQGILKGHPAGAETLARTFRLDGHLKDFNYRGFSSLSWPFSLSISPDAYGFSGGSSQELSFSLRPDGFFSASVRQPFPVRLEVAGKFREGRVDAQASGLMVDIPLLLSFIPDLPLKVDAGTLGGGIAVRGPLADPDFSGSLVAQDLVLRVPEWVGASIGPFTAPILMEGKRMMLDVPAVPVGASSIALRANAAIDGWIPSNISLAIRSRPGSPIPMIARVLGIEVRGSALPNLDLVIAEESLKISGLITIEKADVVLSTKMFEAKQAEAASALLLGIDLGLRFGKGVRVFFPSKDIPIVSGYADPASKLNLVYNQERGDLFMTGEALLRGGDVFYIQRNFFLKNARIVFNETSDKFNPLISLVAELRDSTAEGPVTVTLRADNAPIADFKPRLSSNPPLSEAEIALLLGEGLLDVGDGGEFDLRRVAIAGSEFVPQLNVTKVFEGRVREALGLDVFFLRSQVLQRWLIDISGAGRDRAATLGDYLDETSLYAGKYLGDSIFVHGSLRLQDPLVPSGLFRLDSEFGAEFDTPFGLLEWTVNPQNPENLFINDQSLSLSWRFLF